jgi:hypothetical protein
MATDQFEKHRLPPSDASACKIKKNEGRQEQDQRDNVCVDPHTHAADVVSAHVNDKQSADSNSQ